MAETGDTIAAIATARGVAALAIVRLTGPKAISVAASCFSGSDLSRAATHTVHVGTVTGTGNEVADQVVATVFRSPRSFTGEDVVEFTCHGGDFAARLVLQATLDAGARPAEPGEFTQRAFLNGKLDLAQAEAVADLIHASSSLTHRISLSHLQGRYSERLRAVRSELLDFCAYVELELDFSEEDVAFADRSALERTLDRADALIRQMLGSVRLGQYIRDGVKVVIAGRPNAGKSTLLNALLGKDRAIVSPMPGTTRDEIEAEVEIQGLRFRFVDTAGLRDAGDIIEAEGVQRAKRAIDEADILLYVYDVSLGMGETEAEMLRALASRMPPLPMIMLANKIDLATERKHSETSLQVIGISAERARSTERELRPVIEAMLTQVRAELGAMDLSSVVIDQRHQYHLEQAGAALTTARSQLQQGAPGELLSSNLRMALNEIGAITGEITNEEVLERIFSRFCIGK